MAVVGDGGGVEGGDGGEGEREGEEGEGLAGDREMEEAWAGRERLDGEVTMMVEAAGWASSGLVRSGRFTGDTDA